MALRADKHEYGWNPWHGCTRISPGCLNCYVYRQDAAFGTAIPSSRARKTADYNLPVRRTRSGRFAIPSGSVVFTCFTSDFLLEDADQWRAAAWEMIRLRSDVTFIFFTKRIERFTEAAPPDWGEGYDNVIVGCTVENQQMAERRLPLFAALNIRRKVIVAAPLLGPLNLMPWLDSGIAEVSVGGESGPGARVLDYQAVLDIRRQCIERQVAFRFHQTGARLLKDGRIYSIPRQFQHRQAARAAIDYTP